MTDGSSSIQSDDEAIILSIMYGEEDGLRQLLRIYGGKVKGLLKKQLGHVLDDADILIVLNESAYKVFHAAESFNSKKGSLSTWFYKIAYNTALDLLRKEEPHRHQYLDEYDIDENWLPPILQEKPKTDPKNTQLYKDLLESVEQLPDLQKKIIMADITCGEDASAGALAKRFGTTKNTIYVSRNKALNSLRKAMEKKGYAIEWEDKTTS